MLWMRTQGKETLSGLWDQEGVMGKLILKLRLNCRISLRRSTEGWGSAQGKIGSKTQKEGRPWYNEGMESVKWLQCGLEKSDMEFPDISSGLLKCHVKKFGLYPNNKQKWLKEFKGLKKTWGSFPRACREAEWTSVHSESGSWMVSWVCSLSQRIGFPFNFKVCLSLSRMCIHSFSSKDV